MVSISLSAFALLYSNFQVQRLAWNLWPNHWLVISNIGEEKDTVCIYDSMQNRPDGECISLVARYVQCPDSHITIKVMNVQLQDNGYACGELAVAFATSLIHGEDPTQLELRR